MVSLQVRIRRGRNYYTIRTRARSEFGAGFNRRDAEELFTHYRNLELLEKHGVPLPTRSDWTMQQLRDWDMRIAERDGGELDSRRRCWEPILETLGRPTLIEDLTPGKIQRTVDQWLEKTGSATINRRLSILRKAFARAREPRSEAFFGGDPVKGIANLKERLTRKKPVPWRPEQVATLLKEAWQLARHPPRSDLKREFLQNAQIAELLYLTGSRKSQILQLRRDQAIDHPKLGRLLWFQAHKRGKPRFYRYVGRLAEILDSIPDDGSGWFFQSQQCQGRPRTDFRRFLTLSAMRAHLPRITAHTLRHSLSSGLLAAGEPIAKVQARLGHKSRRTTEEQYAELFPDEILEATAPPQISPAPIPQTPLKATGKNPIHKKAVRANSRT